MPDFKLVGYIPRNHQFKIGFFGSGCVAIALFWNKKWWRGPPATMSVLCTIYGSGVRRRHIHIRHAGLGMPPSVGIEIHVAQRLQGSGNCVRRVNHIDESGGLVAQLFPHLGLVVV